MTDPSATVESQWPLGEARLTHPASRRRHHRWLTLPSSVVLMICIFLPTLRVCGDTEIPLTWPMFWTPYVVGALVFTAVLAAPRHHRALGLALRIVLGVTVVGWGLVCLSAVASGGGPVQLVPFGVGALVILGIATPERTPEAMIARCGLVTGIASAAWFAVLATDKGALFGADVSMVAAITMAAGCLWWWIEARQAAV